MKKAIALTLVLLLCSMAVACGNAGSPAAAPAAAPAPAPEAAPAPAEPAPAEPATGGRTSDWVLAYICKDLSQQWFIDESEQMVVTALGMGASDMLLLDAGMNPETYMTHLDNVISQGVDMIIVCPPDQQLSQMTVDRCSAAGIPVIAVDDALIDENGNVIAPVVELSAFDVGLQQGVWLGDYYKDNLASLDPSEVAFMVMTINELGTTVLRSEGAKQAFLENVPGFDQSLIIEANYNGTPEQGFEIAAATITANPHITYWMVTAVNDEGAMGATRALEQAGKDRDAVVVGMGAYHAKDEFQKDYSAIKAAIFFDARIAGDLVVREAMNYLINGTEMCKDHRDGGQNFGRMPFGGALVTRDNFREVMGDAAD